MIKFTTSGSFKNTERFLRNMQQLNVRKIIESEAEKGRQALIEATPKDSGLAASSWDYTISQNRGGVTITWTNSDIENGFPVAIALQYGYATGSGGYVQGRDYINSAMKPVFDAIADKVWKVVKSS